MSEVRPSRLEQLRQAPVSVLLLLTWIAVFVWALVHDPHARDAELTLGGITRAGALTTIEAWTGQPWRVLTSGVVHMGWWHLGANLAALVALGPGLERIIRPWRMLPLMVGAQLAAAAADLLFGRVDAVGCGGEGIIFGLLGAILLGALRTASAEAVLKSGALPLTAGMLLLFLLLMPGADPLQIFGGLLGGVAMMSGLQPRVPGQRVSLLFASLLIAIATLFAIHDPHRADWQLAHAIAHFEKHDCAGALPYLLRARELHNSETRPADLDHDIGNCQLTLGDLDGGIQTLQQATDEGSVDAAVLWSEQDEDLHRALLGASRALALEPGKRRTREAVLRSAWRLTEAGELPKPGDVEPLAHLPEVPELEPVRQVIAASKAATLAPADLGNLLRAADPRLWNPDGGLADPPDGGWPEDPASDGGLVDAGP